MSMFTLAISCLTTSNLPWFMDLTFQVPTQHCSLQHQTLLLSPVTSTTGCCFCFGSIPSFFLELFLHWSPVAYWAPTDLGSSSFSVLSFCLFILSMGFSRQKYWSGLPFPSPVDHILSETVAEFILGGSNFTADDDCSMKLKDTLWKESYDQPRQNIKKQRHYFANKGLSSQSYGFSSSHVWMWELDYKETWAPKNWCFWTVVLKKTLDSPLDCKEIQPVNPKGNQSWIFIGRTSCWSLNSNTLATWWEELTHWKRLWCWERLKAGGEGDNRG